MTTKLKPLGSKILIEPLAAPDRVGSIFLPEQAKETPQEGIVREIGEGKIIMRLNGFVNEPMPVIVGQRVLVNKYGGTEIKIDGKEYKLCDIGDILAILK